MNEFENLKKSYIDTIQLGIVCHSEYNETKRGNEILHKFCEILVENSNYSESDKLAMKHELEIVKETLSQEIELRFCKM